MDVEKKTVFFGLNAIWPIPIGGTETYVQQLARELITKGWHVAIICGTKKTESFESEWHNIRVFALTLDADKVIDRITLKELILSKTPQIFHLHSTGELLTASHVKIVANTGVKCFYTAHLGNNFCVSSLAKKRDMKASTSNCLRSSLKEFNIRTRYPVPVILFLLFISRYIKPIGRFIPAFYLKAREKSKNIRQLRDVLSGSISISPWITNVMRSNHFPNIIEIPQGVNITLKNRAPESDISNSLKIAFVGRISQEKGIETILDAIELLSGEKVHFVLIGAKREETAYATTLLKRIDKIGGSVYLNLSQEQLFSVLEKCTVLCLPTKIREVAPLVVEEARALGLVSIVSDINNVSFFDKAGISFFKTGNPSSLAQTILDLKKEQLKRIQSELKEYSVTTFENIAQTHISLYNS